jgi:hypothetical protein
MPDGLSGVADSVAGLPDCSAGEVPRSVVAGFHRPGSLVSEVRAYCSHVIAFAAEYSKGREAASRRLLTRFVY